jgi:hypothetical protein
LPFSSVRVERLKLRTLNVKVWIFFSLLN